MRIIVAIMLASALVIAAGGCSSGEPKESAHTHVLKVDSAYYTSSPAQGRPPDGEWKAGTKVTKLEGAGSYTRVRSEDGVEAYVSTDALDPKK